MDSEEVLSFQCRNRKVREKHKGCRWHTGSLIPEPPAGLRFPTNRHVLKPAEQIYNERNGKTQTWIRILNQRGKTNLVRSEHYMHNEDLRK